MSEPLREATPVHDFQAQERAWGGYTLRELTVSGSGGISLLGPYAERMRLTFILENVGGSAYCREHSASRDSKNQVPRPICFKPAGMEGWLCSDTGGSFRAVSVIFDKSAFASGPLADVDPRKLAEPRMMFSNARLWKLALDLTSEWNDPREFTPLYCDSIMAMMLIELVRAGAPERGGRKGGLTRAQLNRAIEYIEQNPVDRVRLSELAALTGLSLSHFSHAFRQSTGMPPYRWQLNARVRKAQELLIEGAQPLAAIALATGFSDQAHFTRTFRQITGSTPAAWLRARPR
jgi:AraC family transcriptional regulator